MCRSTIIGTLLFADVVAYTDDCDDIPVVIEKGGVGYMNGKFMPVLVTHLEFPGPASSPVDLRQDTAVHPSSILPEP